MSMSAYEVRFARWAGDLLGISAILLIVVLVISALPVGETRQVHSAIFFALTATALAASLVVARVAIRRVSELRRARRVGVWCAVLILQLTLAGAAFPLFSPSGAVLAVFLVAPALLSCLGLLLALTSRHTEQA